jgi:hypothetical protein
MGRVLATILLSTLALTDWTATAKKANESIVYVESESSKCTGFVIHAAWKGDTDLILTCQHCDGKSLFADYVTARIVYKHAKADLLILEVADTGRPALTLAQKNPAIGEEVGSYGFGYALERPMFRLAHVSDDKAELPDVDGGPFVMIDAGYVPGQSGGAVVNAAGEVVSIVQRASGLVGIGIGAEAIRQKVSRFLPKTP